MWILSVERVFLVTEFFVASVANTCLLRASDGGVPGITLLLGDADDFSLPGTWLCWGVRKSFGVGRGGRERWMMGDGWRAEGGWRRNRIGFGRKGRGEGEMVWRFEG